ncbi:MAG: chloride channel protein [bacterium]
MKPETTKKIYGFTKYFRLLRIRLQKFLSRLSFPDYSILSFFAVITGAIAGLAAVFFHHTIEFFNNIFFEQTAGGLFFLGTAAVILLPAIGMLIQYLMILIAPEVSKKRGVAEVIKAVALKGGYIPFRTTLFHFLAPVICIGSGGTVGPEGPAAQLGGGVASKMGSILGLSDSRRRMFTAAGSGAAIAAIFNTPLGGIFFALEIILLNDLHTPTLSVLILASVTASAISRIFLGDLSVFVFNSISIGNYEQLYLYAILGLTTGVVSILFIRYSSFTQSFLKKRIFKKFPQWSVMILVGSVVGLCGFFYKDIFGIGYQGINNIIAVKYPINIVLILLAMKFLLVPLVLNSGGFGGTFAPSLFMGACIGYIFSSLLNSFFGLELNTTTYILVGMGAMLGGINSIPISAILILFEMTKEYAFILPLMLAVVISNTLVQVVFKSSVHLKHLEHEGYHLSKGRDTGVLRSLYVEDFMKPDVEVISEEMPLNSLLTHIMDSTHSNFYVSDSSGKLKGIITETELRPIITEYEYLREMLVARDIARPGIVIVHPHDDLEYVLNLFAKQNVEELPVAEVDDIDTIIGTIKKQDIISAYNQESLKNDAAGGLARELKSIKKLEASKVAEGYSIVEHYALPEFVGKSLAQLRIRNRFGLEVLMIKKENQFFSDNDTEVIVPGPDYLIQKEDVLVFFGKDENISVVSSWN